jgi:NAD dependent epimerase/dehydratase
MSIKENKILVTGAAGFIGSHLVELLLDLGFFVRAFVRYNSANRWGWLEKISKQPRLEVIAGDIRDYDSVFNAMKGCSEVFHLAALIGIPYSYVSPLAYIKTNIEGTYNVLESARQQNIKQVMVTSTSETYGTAQYVPIDENHPLTGQSPYSASKIGADQMAISYFRSFNLPVKIARPFNTYGPRQSARAIIPAIIIQILSGRKEIELGSLTPTRDLSYVKDTVNGLWQLSQHQGLYGEAVNIGTNTEISIGELFQLINKLLGTNTAAKQNIARIRPDKSEVARLMCDNTKITSKTAWRPKFDLESGLKETITWFKSNMEFYKSDIYNI